MTTIDAISTPIDPASAALLASRGLEMRLVDASDEEALDCLGDAIGRGFNGPETSEDGRRDRHEYRNPTRSVAVYDRSIAHPDVPVSSIVSWPMDLTLPGGSLAMWSISGVTVASTHRRRGIARAMLEGEVRAAHAAGFAIAGLTVSEATLYGRYGFGAAAPVATIEIDTARAGWRAGDATTGRVEFISREELAAELEALADRTRARRIGTVSGWTKRWRQIAGLVPGDKGLSTRGVRYLDADGETTGVMSFRLEPKENEFTGHTLHVNQLLTATDDALAELWRFALGYDLVSTVRAELRPVDDPIRWLVSDERAVTATVRDHGWLRIIDVARTLEARRYAADLDLVLAVDDPLALADGTYRVVVRDGEATVTRTDGAPDLRLGVSELSSVLLGAVPAVGLRAAGRVEGDLAAAHRLDTALHTERAPHLSIWY